MDDKICPSELFEGRYKSCFFNLYFYDVSHLSYTAKGISALYKYIYIIVYCLAYYRLILRSPSLSKFMKALYKAHFYGVMIHSQFEKNWIDVTCEKNGISKSASIILCFSGVLNAKKQKFTNKGFWWIDQPIFILFLIGFLLIFLVLIATSFIHLMSEPMGLKTIYMILFWGGYTIATCFVSCMMKAHLWDAHQLLKKIKCTL